MLFHDHCLSLLLIFKPGKFQLEIALVFDELLEFSNDFGGVRVSAGHRDVLDFICIIFNVLDLVVLLKGQFN